jgi:hypothetical protein
MVIGIGSDGGSGCPTRGYILGENGGIHALLVVGPMIWFKHGMRGGGERERRKRRKKR